MGLVLVVCLHIVAIWAGAFSVNCGFFPSGMILRDKHCWQHSLAALNQLFPVFKKYRKNISITSFHFLYNRWFKEAVPLYLSQECQPQMRLMRYQT